MPIRAVFFDLDDTLIDTSGTRFARAEIATALLVREYPHLAAADLYQRFLTPHPLYPTWAIGVEAILKELDLHETAVGIEATRLWHFNGSEHLATALAGVMEAIAAIRPDIALGVITNGDHDVQRHKFDALRLDISPRVFVSADRAGYAKPDPRIFAMALEEAAVEPHEAVFIGDIFDIDVVGALSAGMHAVWYNPAKQQLESDVEPRHHELHSYADLSALLEMLDRRLIEP